MHSRPTPRVLTALAAAIASLGLGLGAGSPADARAPASVAIESVGPAPEAGWALIHVTASRPTEVQVSRAHAPERLVADFLNAVLAPPGPAGLRDAPALGRTVTLSQVASRPPVVRLEVSVAGGDLPTVQRFADCRGLTVRVPVRGASSAGGLAAAVAEAAAGPGASPRPQPAALVWPSAPSTRGALPDGARVLLASLPGSARPLAAETPAVPPAEPTPVVLASTLAGRAPGLVAARPRPEGTAVAQGKPQVQRVRVVSLEPLTVAVDCSRPLPYRLGRGSAPPRYVLTFPGATLAPGCLQAVSLRPARDGEVAVELIPDGVKVVIPARDGELCSAKPGAHPQTVVCELTASETAAPAAGPPAEGESAPKPPAAPPPAGDPLINVDFQDAALVEILTALARYADKNIITTPSVTGQMSVHLSRVTLTQALDVVVALNGLEYVLIGDRNYVVGKSEELARLKKGAGAGPLPLELVYTPQNTTPQRIMQELAEVVKARGVTIRIVEDAKNVVFMEVPDQATLEWVREHAKQVDVPPSDTSRWIRLEHLKPAQAASALKGLSPRVEVRLPGPEAPQVAVIGLAGKSVDVDEAEQLLKNIDVAVTTPGGPEGVAVATRTLRISYVDPEGIVQLIQGIYGEKVQAVKASTTTDTAEIEAAQKAGKLRPASTIVLRGPADLLEEAARLIAEVDQAPPQVQITATMTDVNVDRSNNTGFTWTLPGLIVSEPSTAGGGFNFGKIIRSPLNLSGSGAFQATFDALLKQTNGTILSRTKLVAVNGKSAEFLVGDIIPYETAVAGDGTVTRSVQFENIGLGLKFAPTVDMNDQITLFLSPEVRSFSGFSPQGYPIVATREARTIVRVKDGDVIVIGGLLRDEEIRTLSGIPFLKDIPVFGELFRKRNTSRKKSEVVVFAEINLLRPGQAPAGGAAAGEG